MNILIVSDRSDIKRKTDYLTNAFIDNYNADVIWTKERNEKLRLVDRVLNKLNLEIDKGAINERILQAIRLKTYDLVIIFKGNRVFPSTLKKIKCYFPSSIVISWSGDNMTKWHNKSILYHFGIDNYDAIFSVNIPSYKKMSSFCNKPLYFFDKRADKKTHYPVNINRNNFNYDVIFIGSYEKDRLKTLNYLASNGITINIFGAMWNRCKDVIHPNLIVNYEELIGSEYTKAISNSKITLGFLRKVNDDTQTSRSFEIPACGGFMLMERTEEHLKLFSEGVEAEFFSSDYELLKKLKFYLSSDNEREVIASNGYKKVVDCGYYFDDLAIEMIDKVKKI